jgi:P-type Cu+ transporter
MVPSLISHSVVVRHPTTLSVDEISDTLENVGFEVHSAFQTDEHGSAIELYSNGRPDSDDVWKASLENSVSRWRRRLDTTSWHSARRWKEQTHYDHCAQCRQEQLAEEKKSIPLEKPSATRQSSHADEKSESISKSTGDSRQESFIAIDSGEAEEFRADLAIEGMTCSSCVSAITQAVEKLSFVRSVDVNLLTNSASVVFQNKSNLQQITTTIEDSGYDVSVDRLEPLTRPKPTQVESDRWQAAFSIGGMTCSSCVSTVTKALEGLSFVEKVEVNLISNSGTVQFHDKTNSSIIQETIEDIGYEATLDSLVNLGQEIEESLRRSIAIKIQGMHCHHCPPKVVDAMEKVYGNKITIDIPPTMKDNILEISYIPNPPDLTIRHILATLKDVDPVFNPEIYHPPTLEERSKYIQQRERNHILYRLALSVAVAIPTFIIGIVYMSLVSSENPSRVYLEGKMWAGNVSRAEWALFILATPVYFFAADVFHIRAFKELRAMWRPGSVVPILRRFYRFGSMNMLMSLGTTIAYFASIAELGIEATQSSSSMSSSTSSSYFDSVVFLTMFLLVGRFLEAYSKARTGDAVTSLGNLRPSQALLVENNKDVKIPVDLLEIGDVIRVPNGTSPPFDGIVLEGQTAFDESSLTGEARPITKEIGDTVYSGTVNTSSPITIRLTTISGTSMLDQIIKVVREGQTKRAPVERVADIITGHFVPFVVLIGIATWIIWLALGESGALPHGYRDTSEGGWALWSLRFSIAVFVIACPCGIGLAAPTALFVGGGLAAKHGILVKGGGEAFQEASQLDCIVFDKTGTITQGGEPKVTEAEVTSEKLHHDAVLTLARKLEEGSSHPVAKAIASYCNGFPEAAIGLTNVEELPGRGMRANFVLASATPSIAIIGNEALLSDEKVPISDSTAQKLEDWKSQGKSVALLAVSTPVAGPEDTENGAYQLVAAFAISDALRPEAITTIRALQNREIAVWMLSGDNETTAKAVGNSVGIPSTNIIAGVLPDGKAEKIQYLQRTLPSKRKNKRALVAMVGDGINDAPALSAADVGIAIGSGSDVALSSASFVLIHSDLQTLLTLVDLARTVFRRVWFNFGWALVYNVVAMPVAAGVLYPIVSNGSHVRLDPVWASLAMALSSVSVVSSSLVLRTRIPFLGFRSGSK